MKLALTGLASAVLLVASGCGNYDRAPGTPSFTACPARLH
jgi:hypothetical protein